MPKKELYSILGIAPDATTKEIRNAYLARVRVIHPDRFDQVHQAQEWKQANEMLTELNEAYSVLKHPSSRTRYDNSYKKENNNTSKERRQTNEQESSSTHQYNFNKLTPGSVPFTDLPKNVQDKLLERQQDKIDDQFRIELTSSTLNYIYVAILLCWFWYLFSDANGARWEEDTLLWYVAITLAVGGLLGRNIITIGRWTKAKIKPNFYVTPIYFIWTDLDTVSFIPIWGLMDIAVTHNYTNGSYRGSDVVLKFNNYEESLHLSSKKQVEILFEKIKKNDAFLRETQANKDYQFFRDNDDFYMVRRSENPTTVSHSKSKRAFIYIVSVLICAVGLIAAIDSNDDLSKRWERRHATSHKNISDSSTKHISKPSYQEQPLPYSGSIKSNTSLERIAPFEIKASKESHHLVKLVDAYTRTPILTVFVRRGTTSTINVPLGTYEIRYASGNTWYGNKNLFGTDTTYNKADKLFAFKITKNQISGFTIILYSVPSGNLSTSPIKPTQF